MINAIDIAAISQAVAALTGPSRAVDFRVHQLLNFAERVMTDAGATAIPGRPARDPTYGLLGDIDLADWSEDEVAGLADNFAAPFYTASLEAVLAAIDARFPDAYYVLGKGRSRPDEPLWGAGIYDHGGNALTEDEHVENLALAALLALLNALDA